MGHPTRMGDLLSPLGEGKLLSFLWDPTVPLQTGPVETLYTWNGTCTI